MVSPLRRLVLSALLGLLPIPCLAGPHDVETGLLRDLEVVESSHACLCAIVEARGDLGRSVAGLADQVRAGIASEASGPATVAALNRALFVHVGIRGSPDLKDPCNLLPSAVLGRKQGYCVGIAALFLLVAERLDLPVFAVATPSHVFLRYDDGIARINIETLQGGASIADEQYVREQRIPETSIRRGVFMRNLTTDEFLAQVHNNLGVVQSERKCFDKAAMEYERALALDSRLPAAWYNYGNDLLRQHRVRCAARHLSESLRLYPADVWALNNRALAYLEMGRREKARRDFEAALGIDPRFAPARRNLEWLRGGQTPPGTP